jgi:hypothetical protein
LFRRETRTPGLTKNIPDICGNYGGYGAECKGGLSERTLLVPKLRLGNAVVFEAPLRRGVTRGEGNPWLTLSRSWSFADNCVPKLELGNEDSERRYPDRWFARNQSTNFGNPSLNGVVGL